MPVDFTNNRDTVAQRTKSDWFIFALLRALLNKYIKYIHTICAVYWGGGGSKVNALVSWLEGWGFKPWH